MNTIWSTYVQGIGTLYHSRSIRFSDLFKSKYKDVFQIEGEEKILEIGCGPGALSESLSRWYPNAQICGIDRDSNSIDFACRKVPFINYIEGDAAKLPFKNESFNVTISNTVAEHIEPSKFYGEQYRVLKKNGICLVLSARKGINIAAPCIMEETQFEKEIWKRAQEYYADIIQKYKVCASPQNEAELPRCMEHYGFRNVTTEYITVNLTPDNPIYSKQMAHLIINANRQSALDNIDGLLHLEDKIVTDPEVEELKNLVNEKYDKRIDLYDKGIKQWDTNVSVTMIVRGIK